MQGPRSLELILGKRFDEIDASDIERLVALGVKEDDSLEFKREPWADEEGKKECAKDIAALANAQGGGIVVGIAERDGIAAGATPFVSSCTLNVFWVDTPTRFRRRTLSR